MHNFYAVITTFLLTVSGVVSLSAQQRYPVYFESGQHFFESNFSGDFGTFQPAPEELVNGRFVRLLQCRPIPNAAQRAASERAGMQIIEYIPEGAYLVSLPQGFDFRTLTAMNAQSISPLLPEWKIARNLREQPHGQWAVRGEFVEVTLLVWPHISIAQAAELCAKSGIKVLEKGRHYGVLTALIHRDEIHNTAALPFVQHLELVAPPGEPEDTRGRALHRANMLDVTHPDGLKYTGEGVSVLVRDDGAVGPHIDFQGRMVDLSTSDAASATHGDGVGGIMSGAGNLNPYMRGMAAGTQMYVINYTAAFQDATLGLHLDAGVSITNSSYSNGCNAGYTANARTVDRQIFENPGLMHVFSAGNNGTSDCNYGAGANWGNITGGHKVAKNALAVANLRNNGILENSSSRGPVHDGRLKPDIAANGFEHNSTAPNNAYLVFGGTSGAAPGVAGCMAQLSQAYKETFNAPYAPTALLKAALLNTANDQGNGGPDFKFGWGHVNAWRALNLIREGRWQEGALDQGEVKTHDIQVPFGVRQLRVMVYWTDPEASTGASKALVNDLDLRVISPSGAFELPWVLDPTPDPLILNMPAGKGRDSLNNVEQVSMLNPPGGTYTVEIRGFAVPLGPQQYYIVWEFDTDAVKITYPSGGEGLVPGQVERIHWDAYGASGNFTLRYSTDGGETFFPITTLTNQPEARMYDWTVPVDIISERVHIMLIRGAQRDTTALPVTIAPVPAELEVTQVCLDSLTVQWKAINDTLKYEVYLLGDKYMEIVGKTEAAANQYTMPIQNAGLEKWVSVRAANDYGLAGRRANAIRWPGELKNCPQPFDLGLRGVVSPAGSTIIQCEPTDQTVSVRIVNEGQTPITDAKANYQVNGGSIVSETLPEINPGDTLIHIFSSPISITDNLDLNLLLWVNANDDLVRFNDTLRLRFPVVVQAASGPYTQDFQVVQFPPSGWNIVNPDGLTTWTRSANVTGPNGEPTRAMFMDCFNYNAIGAIDEAYIIPIELTEPNPALVFDLSHARYDNNYSELLRVEVLPNCDLNATPAVIWEKSGSELATAPNSTAAFAPTNAVHWRREVANLTAFAGQKVIVRFVIVNGWGNNLYIDNVGIVSVNPNPPIAQVNVAKDTACRLEYVYFSAVPQGTNTTFSWSFGALAQPANAIGPGPHEVRYVSAGPKTVRLIATNENGADTAFYMMTILNLASANFTSQVAGLTVTFNNTSSNAMTYLWEFGDGQTSTEANPTHTYAMPGVYDVKLTATNLCAVSERTAQVSVTTSTRNPEAQVQARVLPNPSQGAFRVAYTLDRGRPIELRLFNAEGKLVDRRTGPGQTGLQYADYQLQIPPGVYQLQIGDGAQTLAVLSVAIQ